MKKTNKNNHTSSKDMNNSMFCCYLYGDYIADFPYREWRHVLDILINFNNLLIPLGFYNSLGNLLSLHQNTVLELKSTFNHRNKKEHSIKAGSSYLWYAIVQALSLRNPAKRNPAKEINMLSNLSYFLWILNAWLRNLGLNFNQDFQEDTEHAYFPWLCHHFPPKQDALWAQD